MSANLAQRWRGPRRSASPTFPLECLVATLFLGCVVLISVAFTRCGLRSSDAPYYELYAAGIRQHHLWLEEAGADGGCRWDLSEFGGKCYAYWGILPALVHVILPFASDRFLTILAFTFGVLYLTKLVLLLSRRSASIPLSRSLPVLLGMIAFSMMPAAAVAARIYEESIGFGAGLGLAGLYYVVAGLDCRMASDEPLSRRTWMGIVLLALAGLARVPWLGVACLAAMFWYISTIRRVCFPGWRELSKAMLPIALAGLVSASLNFSRFADPFEFGLRQNSANSIMSASGIRPISAYHVFGNAVMYLLVCFPPLLNPFTTTRTPETSSLPLISQYFAAGRPYQEYGLALIVGFPVLLVAVPGLWRRSTQTRSSLAAVALSLPLSLAVLSVAGTIYRYQLEALLPVMLLLTPQALQVMKEASAARIAGLWAVIGVGMFFSVLNSVWIVRTVCDWWSYC